MNGKFVSLLVCCLIWGCSGKPTNVFLSYQDSLGQYSFGYSAPGSARSEVKTLNGAIRGTYSYVDENGVIQSTQYVADDDGFHVIATNLPQAPLPVEETAEVSAARKEHLEALQLAEQMAEQMAEQTAEKAENDQEQKVLSKESVDRSEQYLEHVIDYHKSSESMEKVEKMDIHNQELNYKEAEKQPSEENSLKVSNTSILKDRLGLDKVPIFRITYGEQQSEKNLAIEQGSNVTSSK